MSEEELLKYIKTNKNKLLDINSDIYDNLDIEFLINFIDKQQKEIEDLKIKNKKIQEINYRVNKNLLELAEISISKDKIKDKIKNSEILKHNYLGNTEISAIVYKDIIKIVDAQINVLKELLEER